MNSHQIFKEKAITMRQANKSLDEIAESLNLNKSTVYYWIKDIEASITRRPCSKAASIKNRNTWAARRQNFYDDGLREYPILSTNKLFRDFIILYICEGYKRNRNSVGITNSDPIVIKLAYDVMLPLTPKTPFFEVQVHLDNNVEDVKKFWGNLLGINSEIIKVYTRKINMTNRNGRLPHGIFSVKYNNTEFRSKIQSWIDCLKKEWSERGDSNAQYHVPKTCGIARLSYARN
jgi:hypothetical protein